MRAVSSVAASLGVGTLSTHVVCPTNFPNASGCLATQPVAQQQRGLPVLAKCTSLRRVVNALDTGRQNSLAFNSSAFACRCAAADDAINLPRDSQGFRSEQNDRGEFQDGTMPSSLWDLPTGHEQMQETEQGSDWARWQQVFAEVEANESESNLLKAQIEEAVKRESFGDAARLKTQLDIVTNRDIVADVSSEMKKALAEERYDDATLFRDKAGVGLVGWWVGLAEGGNDPYGRIINICTAHGRLVAKGYSARQLATAAAGVPLFEIFVTKNGDRDFRQQAVYLQRELAVAGGSAPGSTKTVDTSVLDLMNSARDEDASDTAKEHSEDTSDSGKGKAGDAAMLEEPLSKIMSFLKDRMPDVKLKVFKIIPSGGAEAEIPKIVEHLMEQEDSSSTEHQDLSPGAISSNANSSSGADKKGLGGKFPLDGKIPVGDIGEVEKETPIRLVVGGVLQNNIDSEPPNPLVRVPARIVHEGRNSFSFHIEDPGSTPAGDVASKDSALSWKVATVATQASADLMPDDVARVLWNVEKVPVKVSKEMGEIIRLAVSQAQRRRGLFTSTNFRRMNVDNSTDPLCGLYIGAFGPYTSEVVQLQRKYGHWKSNDSSSGEQKLEFFDYVEAVKLTGDLNVPAGQVTFRARIGRESRLSHRGAYPAELGVVARYKGQGRLAEPGFRNPQWIDGELVLLDGKGGGRTNGAALGFVYSVPERHFLVLFKRLNLSVD